MSRDNKREILGRLSERVGYEDADMGMIVYLYALAVSPQFGGVASNTKETTKTINK